MKSSVLSPQSRIFVAGHRGMVGSAIIRCLKSQGYENVITKTHKELDLVSQQAVREFFCNEKIDYAVVAAAKVGGINANNSFPADFIYQNLMIEANIIHEAFRAGVNRLLFLGSSCIYPKNAPQPMKEEYLLTGYLEPTNEPYAIAKIAGIKLCESYNRQYKTKYRSVMPTNLYGPNDNYDLENSHVLPAMIRKFHIAKRDGSPKVILWGTGKPRREFLYVDDLASACVFLMGLEDEVYEYHTKAMMSHINVGTGKDTTIAQLAEMVRETVGFEGEIVWDASKPDGMVKKLLDVSLLENIGWKPDITLKEGIQKAYQAYLKEKIYG